MVELISKLLNQHIIVAAAYSQDELVVLTLAQSRLGILEHKLFEDRKGVRIAKEPACHVCKAFDICNFSH